MCDKPGKRLPCLHEQTFAGQRTANGFAVSCPRDAHPHGAAGYDREEIGSFAFADQKL